MLRDEGFVGIYIYITKRILFPCSCVGVAEVSAVDIDKYHCAKCEPLVGPTIREFIIYLVNYTYSSRM